jgi:phosphate starvation-inducible PhoH-like protein
MEYFTIDCSSRSFDEIQTFMGENDQNLKMLENQFGVSMNFRNDQLIFACEDDDMIAAITDVVQACFDWIGSMHRLKKNEVRYLCSLAKEDQLSRFNIADLKPVVKTRNGKMIFPKTIGQAILCEAMEKNPIVFSTGVAGTGKTYLAVAYAVSQLKNEKIKKIILTRPAVEAGESLGFLPGDMKEKVDPYLRPLYDALNEILGAETVERLLEKEIIEIAPLAFMRGRTLNDAVVILDEAQNTTQAQMKMFLTRMGQNSQIIVTGDITQIDLIKKKDSGLIQACQILQDIDGIEMVHLSELDVVRHPLVQKIIDAYSRFE